MPRFLTSIICLVVIGLQLLASGEEKTPLRLFNSFDERPYDPLIVPRPGVNAVDVPLRTSFFIMIVPADPSDGVLPETVSVKLQSDGGEPFNILGPRRTFAPGYTGRIFTINDRRYGQNVLGLYIDSGKKELKPSTAYTVSVTAESRLGSYIPEDGASWVFTTEATPEVHNVSYDWDLGGNDHVEWQGSFFNGFVKAGFTGSLIFDPGWELMTEAREEYPNSWELQRDYWLTGFNNEYRPLMRQPNIVREQETRRISSMTRQENGVMLSVEDFFGHEQYGIESGRPVSADYNIGDEVLIADPDSSARAYVLAADDDSQTVHVSAFDDPSNGWKIDYTHQLPEKEDPRAPGLFPSGGTYLRKFDPPGTPRYYWDRLNLEWDRAVKKYGRTMVVDFNDAPGDLSVDGRAWTTAKCLVQYHEVVREITGHLIRRYGDDTLGWRWSVFNEPDLMRSSWRNRDWDELQRFYDYTVDAVLRSFEDHGYDSNKVIVGGLELGAVFGENLKLGKFLTHASPSASGPGALEFNAAYADPALDGKRSSRVEVMCAENDGRGSPLDFISIHAYNSSELMAAKLIRAKEMALDIDPDYYSDLWVNSYESVPFWQRSYDPGGAAVYLGSGYFPAWTADVVRRLLEKARQDSRYRYGETIFTIKQWALPNFDAYNAVVRRIHTDSGEIFVPMPIFHFANLLSTMDGEFRVFPEHRLGGHVVSGFATRGNSDIRIVLYSHHEQDMQGRSEMKFNIDLEIDGVDEGEVEVSEYLFDGVNNSYYDIAVELARKPDSAMNRAVFSSEKAQMVMEMADLKLSDSTVHAVDKSGILELEFIVNGNGINFIVIDRNPNRE